MLYATYDGDRQDIKLQVDVHIGQINSISTNAYRVTELSADGDELEHIAETFTRLGIPTIPLPKGKRQITWYGDIAKCIASAWPSYR